MSVMAVRAPASRRQLASLVKRGEGPTLEFKLSTAKLKEAMQTLCGFLNDSGGVVLFGVRADGAIEGQQVSDQTLREIAQAAERFEPPVHVSIQRVEAEAGREVVAVSVDDSRDARPFTYEGRAYMRVGSTTRRMPQPRYERLLIERGHATRRWENLPAEGFRLEDLDRHEILRTRELAIQQNRISPDTPADPGEILDRLGLRVEGVLTQAAQILYGTRFVNDHPQCLLKMGRFRGSEVTGEIVDNRQEHLNAFAMVREGMAFLERTMPLGARFPRGQVFREDRFPVPLEALREILLNAVMHRDYSNYAGHVAVVVFDDRIEIRSYGRLPPGVTVEQLSGPHISKPTNPLIAGAFHRTGAVEVWGRGTNRVIDLCKQHGAEPPVFEERQGFVFVTFRAAMVAAGDRSTPQVTPQVAPQVTPQLVAALKAARSEPRTREELQSASGIKDREHYRRAYIEPMLAAGWLERTIPEEPRSRLQKYRLTEAGEEVLGRLGDAARGAGDGGGNG